MTESQLHDVIKESVKQVLSELDWKTYQSAIDNALYNPKYKNKYGYLPAALDSFADARNNAFNDQYGSHQTHDSFGSDYYAGSTDIDYGMEKGNEDLYNMTRGKMEYTKGKGWHLKDNMDEAIRRAIRNILK